MKTFFLTLPAAFAFINVYCQTICQTGNENSTLNFTAPAGKVFISVTFASYGTPNGSCGSFTIGSCHAASSQSIVESILLNQNSASIAASNGVFGDPCGGTFKRLYIEAVYGNPLPLRLMTFTGIASGTNNLLQWQTAEEQNTSRFVVERASDGIPFMPMAIIPSRNVEKGQYTYSDKAPAGGSNFYRLKMEDNDGSYQYSPVILIKGEGESAFRVFPNPAKSNIQLTGLKTPGVVQLINAKGQLLETIQVNKPSMLIDLSKNPRGMYFIKYFNYGGVRFEKIIKD